MSDLKFSPVDMQELMEEGVLLAANEAFFWPLGLALTWTFDIETSKYEGELHVREWREDGKWMRDTIELAADDEVGIERRQRFALWLEDRHAAIIKAAKEAERDVVVGHVPPFDTIDKGERP